MSVDAVFLLQKVSVFILPCYHNPYQISQILCANHYQVQHHSVYHQLKFLEGMHTSKYCQGYPPGSYPVSDDSMFCSNVILNVM
jgi:hypothetical protein